MDRARRGGSSAAGTPRRRWVPTTPFRIVAVPAEPTLPPDRPLLVADDAVLAGEWHWEAGPDGHLAFVDDRATPT